MHERRAAGPAGQTRRTTLVLVVVLLIASVACGDDSDRDVAVSVEPVAIGRGQYFAVAWLPGDWLVIERAVEQDQLQQLWSLRPDGSEFERLELPIDPACRRTEYRIPQALPNSRLGLVKSCDHEIGAPLITSASYLTRNMATGELTELATLAPIERAAWGEQDFFPTQTAWRRSLANAIAGVTRNCGSIVRVTPEGVEPLDLTISDGAKSWNLAEQVKADPADGCERFGSAGAPTASPGFDEVAFLASPDAVGVGGPERGSVPSNVYVLDPATMALRVLLKDVGFAAELAWSPDGRWLALAGAPKGEREGVYLVDPATGDTTPVYDEPVTSLAWAPDSTEIVVIRPVEAATSDGLDYELLRLRLE